MKRFMKIRMLLYLASVILIAFVVVGKIKTSCFFSDRFGILCPACGLTRATISIAKLNIKDAIEYNLYYTVIILPLVITLVANDVYVFIKRFLLRKTGNFIYRNNFWREKYWIK